MDKEKPTKGKSSNDSSKRENAADDFLIVALGASAGGIQALQEFLNIYPKRQGWHTLSCFTCRLTMIVNWLI